MLDMLSFRFFMFFLRNRVVGPLPNDLFLAYEWGVILTILGRILQVFTTKQHHDKRRVWGVIILEGAGETTKSECLTFVSGCCGLGGGTVRCSGDS